MPTNRGTREYNIALGARRANSVQEYLISQGVAPGRLRTVSYGKERPLAICSDEACYSKNRRAVTVVGPGQACDGAAGLQGAGAGGRPCARRRLPAVAQDKAQSLADIRAELNQLTADLQTLRAQLVASGPAGFAAAGGDSAIDRMNAMEARLAS